MNDKTHSRWPGGGSRWLVVAVALGAALATGSCDNPACVFSGNCGGGGTLGGANPASFPADFARIQDGAPRIDGLFPSGNSNHSSTPIAVVFNESMPASALQTAIEVIEVSGFGAPVALRPPQLVSDGQVLLLLPTSPLTPGTSYAVRFKADVVVTDLTGTVLLQPADRVLGTFGVGASDPVQPIVVASFPDDGASGATTTPEIAVVFDRPMNGATVNASSFDVQVDGLDPLFDAVPQPISIPGTGGTSTVDTRAFTWRSIGQQGEPASLGANVNVMVDLSPSTSPILAQDGETLPPLAFDFDTAEVEAPLSARIASTPGDAIGIANLDGTARIQVEVAVSGAQAGDRLGMFLFGDVPNTTPPILGALFREVDLTSSAATVTLSETELDLALPGLPIEARLADGALGMAFRLRRGAEFSSVRNLDTSTAESGIQRPILDVTPPALLGFSDTGSNLTTYASDLRGLALVARADEPIRSAEVTTALGTNAPVPPVVGVGGGTLPPVVGSSASGLFVALPVPLGLVAPDDLPLAFRVTVYDRALNASAMQSGTFTQLGAVSPSVLVPAGSVEVEVFDGRTRLPLAGAVVSVHQDNGGAVSFVDSDSTGVDGKAMLLAAPAGETIITADARTPLLYDLFTLHGAQGPRVSLPLRRSGVGDGLSQGVVDSADPDVALLDRRIADSRLLEGEAGGFPVGSCTAATSGGVDCAYGPRSIRQGQVGALGFTAVDPPADEFNYSPLSFFKAYAFLVPARPVAANQVDTERLHVDALLDAAGIDPELRPIDGPPAVLSIATTTGIGVPSGDPLVAVHARVRGVPGAGTVGSGIAFPQGGGTQWNVRAAYAGQADPVSDAPADGVGDLVTDGAIEPDLLLWCQVRDAAGNTAGARPELLALPATVRPLSVPTVITPADGGPSGGDTYELEFADVITGTPGLYRAALKASDGRRWTLVRADGGGATQRIRVPADNLGNAFLVDGAIECSVSAFAWPSFNPASFLWTDVEREHGGFSHTASIVFSQP